MEGPKSPQLLPQLVVFDFQFWKNMNRNVPQYGQGAMLLISLSKTASSRIELPGTSALQPEKHGPLAVRLGLRPNHIGKATTARTSRQSKVRQVTACADHG